MSVVLSVPILAIPSLSFAFKLCNSPYMDYRINNAEFVLLLLIAEMSEVNGYQIRQVAANRGLEAWAGVSSSSIYVMLKKLETRRFVSSKVDVEKKTKGPRGQVYAISSDGDAALKKAIELGLAKCREHDQRFRIALSGIGLFGREKTAKCLTKRRSFLSSELSRLTAIEERQINSPLSATLLFDHIKYGIESELVWLETIISKLTGYEIHNDTDT